MNEVTISAKSAISIKGDTVSYRVDSFNKDPLANTEDVLKRLPGVDVGANGSITVNGKEVKKIFINGKEFFAEDLTTITQNLPANVIEKIKIADYHTDEEIFTGVKKNSDEKIVNLKLKKEYNSGIVGRLSAGYGTKDRYQTGAFANYMAKNGSRTTVLGATSNTGITSVSNTDDKTTAWRSPGVREGKKGSVNFTLGNNSKWEINGSYNYSGSKTYLKQTRYRTTYLQGDSLLLQDENQDNNNNNDRHYAKIRSVVNFNKTTKLTTRLQGSYNIGHGNIQTEDITYDNAGAVGFKRLSSNERNSNNGRYSLRNTFMKRLGIPGRTLVAYSNLNYSGNGAQNKRINNNMYFDPYTQNIIDNRSDNSGRGIYSQLRLKYNQPIGEKIVLSISYDNVYDKSTTDNKVDVLNGDIYIEDTSQTRLFTNTNIDNRAGVDFRYEHNSITSGVGLDAVFYNRRNTDQENSINNQVQKGVNYAPSVFMNYKFSNTKNLQLNYNGNVQTPHFKQLQPIPDYTDSLNIFIGNPGLRPQVSHRIRLRYSANNTKGKNFWANLFSSWESNKIINKTELTNSKRTTTPVNANGNYNITGSVSFTEPVVKNRLKLTLSGNGSMANNVVILNNVFTHLKNYHFTPSLRVAYNTEKSIEARLTCYYSWNQVASVSGIKNILRQYNIAHEAYIKLPHYFNWSYNLQYSYNSGISSGFEQSFLLVSSSIDKSFKKIRALSLRLQIFDAFNNYPTVNRRVGDSYFEDVSVNRLGRYMMFSLIYKFTSFPKAS